MKRMAVGSRRAEFGTRGHGPGGGDQDAVPETVARALGTSRRAARLALDGPLSLASRCARVIAALKAAGADEALVRFLQPIDLAIHAAQPAAVRDDAPMRGHASTQGGSRW